MGAGFTFICGADDFLVGRQGQDRWESMTRDITDEFGREVIDGRAGTVAEVEEAVARFASAVQTVSMFGDRKAVWFRGISFMADNQTGKTEGAKVQVERLQKILESIDPTGVSVLLTACPIDRRRNTFKWLQKASEFTFIEDSKDGEGVLQAMEDEARKLGISFAPGAAQTLLARIQGNPRLALEEVRKLAAYLGKPGATVHEEDVLLLVPTFGEGDMFETVEAFFSLDLPWTLDAIHRHFFCGHDVRPLLTSLQNRNRLMIQLSALQEGGILASGGVNAGNLKRAAEAFGHHFGAGSGEKSNLNVLTQHPFYLSRLAAPLPRLKLRLLLRFQTEFIRAFIEVMERPQEEEGVVRELAVRCLS